MCLIFFSIDQHPAYKFIVASNRDEFYDRKTAPAHFWEDHPQVLAGRDLEAMGTWMGVTKGGKISMLTNYRDPQHINPAAPSRGKLVSDYLINEVSAEAYIHHVAQNGEKYNGFNLFTGTADALYYYSNYGKGVEKLSPGFYGLSNHLLDTPWPKVKLGKEKIAPLLRQSTIDVEAVFQALYNTDLAEDALLPQTGLPLTRERALSSMFIKTDNYGSRCSTVVLIDRQDRMEFYERTYDLKTFRFNTLSHKFDTV